MQNTGLRGLAAAAAVFAAALAAPAAAPACSISPDYRGSTIAERTVAADHVIVGVVVERIDAPDEAGLWDMLSGDAWPAAEIEVREWLKGDGPDRITVKGFGRLGDCRSPVPDEASIMFLAGDSEDGVLWLNHTGVYDAVIPYDPADLRRVRYVLGQ